jgi:hypothetical protein
MAEDETTWFDASVGKNLLNAWWLRRPAGCSRGGVPPLLDGVASVPWLEVLPVSSWRPVS